MVEILTILYDLQKISDLDVYCRFPSHKVLWKTRRNGIKPLPFKGKLVGDKSTFSGIDSEIGSNNDVS